MPKLSATSGMGNTEDIQQFELTPAWIKTATEDQILEKLKALRGNREVIQAKAAGRKPGGGAASRVKKQAEGEDEEVGV